MSKNFMLYVHYGVILEKNRPVSPWELSAIEKTKSNVVVLSTDSSPMVFPNKISLKSGEVFDFGIEINKVDPKFWPEMPKEKTEKITAGAWDCP